MGYSAFNSDISFYEDDYKKADYFWGVEKIYTPNPSQEDRSFIETLLPDNLYFVVTADGTGFLGQIMHKDATKAKAVAELAQYWNISKSDVVAFGDDYNDLDMLSFSGISVAMGNAVDELKIVADFICLGNDEDGLAKWIEEHVLRKIPTK